MRAPDTAHHFVYLRLYGPCMGLYSSVLQMCMDLDDLYTDRDSLYVFVRCGTFEIKEFEFYKSFLGVMTFR